MPDPTRYQGYVIYHDRKPLDTRDLDWSYYFADDDLDTTRWGYAGSVEEAQRYIDEERAEHAIRSNCD